ncbi:MAG: hypothetical protein QOG42_141 [Solirubrobacteraceae bacterium]|jgi:hypothetical protein|nr:hypothetical protein [Solirubrobacteraceae bacterium]
MRRLIPAAAGLLAALGLALALDAATGAAASPKPLVGTFRLTPGKYSGGKATGTYFRMITKSGYFKNPDSSSSNKTYTLGTPGTDGGLVTGKFQSHPSPAFTSNGSARANKIVKPQSFSGIKFSVATLPTDPQSKKKVPAPRIVTSGGKLSGQVQAFTAEWNSLYFNQGAPKPGGGGGSVSGTYNAKTHHFVLTWKSKIKGGPFNGFTGDWHFEGTFKAR